MPDGDGVTAAGLGLSGQVLLELGKLSRDVGDVKIQTAVIADQVKDVPQLAERVRIIELDVAASKAERSASRDWFARAVGGVAVVAAVAAVVAPFFHH